MATADGTKQLFKELIAEGGDLFRQFHWQDRTAYLNWLAQTYYFVRHTSAFLALSVARFGYKNPDWQKRSMAHLREESGHEVLILSDMASLGADIKDFAELPVTSALYQSQYYWLEHESPLSHLGYALYLEGIGSYHCPQIYEPLKNIYGANACQFVQVHAQEDPHHFEKGFQQLENFNADEIKMICQNLKQTHILYSLMLRTISSDVLCQTHLTRLAEGPLHV